MTMVERVAAIGSDIVCPLCGETDFDAYGLRAHFVRGWCEVAEAAEAMEETRAPKEVDDDEPF